MRKTKQIIAFHRTINKSSSRKTPINEISVSACSIEKDTNKYKNYSNKEEYNIHSIN